MQSELEGRDDTEVASAPAYAPEEVRVLVGAGRDEGSVGRHHVRGNQVVAREPVLAGEVADAPAEREAGDAGGGDDATGGREAKGMRRGGDVSKRTSTLGAGGPGLRVAADAP